MEKIYNKLVRDKIADIIKSNGGEPVCRTLSEEEYKAELEKKLFEEYNEVLEAVGVGRIEELADMLEILKALAYLEGATLEDVIEVAEKKAKKRGAFEDKLYLEKVIERE